MPSLETKARLTNTVDERTATFRRALRNGVKIVFGSDTFDERAEARAHVRLTMRRVDARALIARFHVDSLARLQALVDERPRLS